jgi:uncharacterized protein
MDLFRLTLVLTHACDLACAYCSAGPKSARSMDEATGERAIARALAAIDDGGALDLGFFGGEPLLEWPLARRLIERTRALARPRRIEVMLALTTNGSRVDDRTADELVAESVDVAVSIDGLPEVHDAERRTAGGRPTSERALRAFERLRARGAEPRVVTVVRPSNIDRLVEGARFLAELGATVLEPSLDYLAPWRAEDLPRLERAVGGLGALWAERWPAVSISWIDTKVALGTGLLARPIECGFGRGEVAVAPSGRVYPCERLVADDRGAWAIGHVRDGDGPFAPNGATCKPAESSECGGCAARLACSNACACQNLARTGRPDTPDGLVCVLEQACIAAARDATRTIAARAAAPFALQPKEGAA